MKVVCTKKNLHNGLSLTSRIISAGNTLPVLNNILFKTEGGRLRLSSTNLELAVNAWVGGRVEEEGEITVPARLINDYVNNLYGDKITVSTERQKLNLEAERAKTHINSLPSTEFPIIPQVGEEIYTKTQSGAFAEAISQVAFAASYSETQPEISGVLFSFEGKTLTLAATDRYRLAEAGLALTQEVSSPRQVIVPARAVGELGKISATDDVVEIYLNEGQVMFRTPDYELISRLIEGQYPDYKQIIPTNFATEAKLKRDQFIQSIKAASLFATENNNIELEINPPSRQVVINSQSAQAGDSVINLDTEAVGQKNSIIFNYRYLLECLSNLSDEEMTLKVIDASSPAAITPVGRDNYLYIVMPIKV